MPTGFYKRSLEHRQKIGLAMRGNDNRLGLVSSEEHKRNISLSLIGNHRGFQKGYKPWNYIADRTLLKKDDKRNDSAHKEWSRQVKNRDGWRCKISNGNCSGKVVAHHILPWSDFPELRYEINNGITLCHAHHPRRRIDERKMIKSFRALIRVC